MTKERTTSELAAVLKCDPNLIRKWKRRGFLPLAPHGQHGAGRGHDCLWTPEAVEELKAFAATRNYGELADIKRESTPTRKNRRDRAVIDS